MSARVTTTFDRSLSFVSSSPRRDSMFAASPRPGSCTGASGGTNAEAEGAGGREATVAGNESVADAAAGGDFGAESVSVAAAGAGGSGGTAAGGGAGAGTAGFARLTDPPSGEEGAGCDAGGDAVASTPLNDRTSLTSSPRVSRTCTRSSLAFSASLGGTFANSADGA